MTTAGMSPISLLTPGVSYMLVAPGVQTGRYMPTAVESALTQIAAASPESARVDMSNLLGPVRFMPTSRAFTSADVTFDLDPCHAMSGGILTWKSPDGVSHARSGVVRPADVIGHPHSAEHASHFIVPADDAIWRGALEFSRAEKVDRPIFGGVADPSETEIAEYLAAEAAGKGTALFDSLYMGRAVEP